MTIACVGADETEAADECSGLEESCDLAEWNGREVALLSQTTQLQWARAYTQACAVKQQIQEREQMRGVTKQYEVLDLRDELLEEQLYELSENSLEYALYYPSEQEFSFASASLFDPQVEECKSLLKKIVKAVKKTAKKVIKYVEEHKEEILIAAAVLAAAAGAYLLASALGTTAVAEGGSAGKKEEDDPQVPASAPPPPDPIPPPALENVPLAFQPTDLFQGACSHSIQPVGELSLLKDPHLSPSTPLSTNPPSAPVPVTELPLPKYAVVFDTALEAIRSGLKTIARSSSAVDPVAPANLFSAEEIQRWKAEESSLANALFRPQPQNASGMPFPEALYPEFAPVNDPSMRFSRCFQTEGRFLKGMRITFINGMRNSFEEAKASAEYLRKLGDNQQIHGIYNYSNSGFVDLPEALALNYQGMSPITKDLLIHTWTDFHKENAEKPDAKILHICHSQGALHTLNALKQLPKEIRERVIVVSIAGATVVPKEMCFDSFNYASKNDLIHYGENAHVHAFAGFSDNTTMYLELLAELARDKAQLILLEPHESDAGVDHSFISPTFTPIIQEHLNDYEMHKGEYH